VVAVVVVVVVSKAHRLWGVGEMNVYATALDNVTDGVLRRYAAAAAAPDAVVHSYMFRNAYFFLDFGATAVEPWYLLTQRCAVLMRCLQTSRPNWA